MLIGVDLGGTKIEAVALSPAGALLARRRIPAPQGRYEDSLAAVMRLVRALETETGGAGSVGVGIPGTISPATGLVKGANSTWLNGRPFQDNLAEGLGRPVIVENDANCFAVSEAVDGAGAGAHVVWGVIIGTGAGSGIAIDGRALAGRHRIAGEWGHNPLPWPRPEELAIPPCWCGRQGCLETFVSGTGFSAEHARRTAARLSAEDIVAAMRAGDAAARRTYAITLDRMARGMAHVANVIDPDVIVLGGGLSNVDELYADLPAAIGAYVFSDVFTTPVRKHRHGDSSGVRGAAWLWRDPEGRTRLAAAPA